MTSIFDHWIQPVWTGSIGTLAMFALRPGLPAAAVAPAMLLIGLGFGAPLGIVDGEALAKVPAHSSGSAAGLLNFVRIGSEALAVAAYSAVLTLLVRGEIADRGIADAAAAGTPGHAARYAGVQHLVGTGCGVVVLLLGIAIWALSRAPQSKADTTTAVATEAPRASSR